MMNAYAIMITVNRLNVDCEIMYCILKILRRIKKMILMRQPKEIVRVISMQDLRLWRIATKGI